MPLFWEEIFEMDACMVWLKDMKSHPRMALQEILVRYPSIFFERVRHEHKMYIHVIIHYTGYKYFSLYYVTSQLNEYKTDLYSECI